MFVQLILAKSEDLKKQIQVLEQVHARRLDRKEAGIQNLRLSLEESDKQFGTALQAHLINVDTLINLQNSRLNTLKSQFEGDLAELEQEFLTEK